MKWEKVSKIKCFKQNFKIVFFLFKIISELENIKQDDVKDEAKEKRFETELLDLEEARKNKEITPETLSKMPAKYSKTYLKLVESAAPKGKLNPFKPCVIT